MHMRNPQQGFVGLILLLLVGAFAAAYFVKDESGISYLERMTHKKEEVMKEVDGYKDLMKERDVQIQKNMK